MRKGFLILWMALLPVFSWAAPGEKVCVVTDRNSYIAGDLVWFSLYCVDQKGNLSPDSATAYLELVSREGTAVTAKAGLMDGRGAGTFRLPLGVPTGNYRLVAYTAAGCAESPLPGSCVLSVYNTTSTARSSGVEITESPFGVPVVSDQTVGPVSLSLNSLVRAGSTVQLMLQSLEEEDLDLSVSVYHADALEQVQNLNLVSFLQQEPSSPAPGREEEYDGEIIRAVLSGDYSTGATPQLYLSSAGAPSNVYIGQPDRNGEVRFYTGNIYGDRELVCEVLGGGEKSRVEIQSPFVHPSSGELPDLQMGKDLRNTLVARKEALRSDAFARQDTLARFLPKREDLLLSGNSYKRYHLDDYTRFPTVREVLVEIIPTLRIGRSHGQLALIMNQTDGSNTQYHHQDNILTMMDGVVINDINLLLDFDAMLLEDIDLYSQPIVVGMTSFNGAVNFITKKNYVTALHFPETVRVVSYQGVSYPVAYTGSAPALKDGERDLRQVLYWHPSLQIEGGQRQYIQLKAPSYAGQFRVVVQGRSASGTPVCVVYSFEVQ